MTYASPVRALGFAVLVLACSSTPEEQPAPQKTLDQFANESIETAALPGVAIAIVKDGKVTMAKGWGYSNLEKKTPMSPDATMVVGSLSKTITGTALMQLVESGKLSLDADVNTYLPFKVRNPKWPDVPITLKMLATHTSSIQESSARLVSLAKPGDPTTSLRDLLEPYLTPGGATYVEGETFSPQKPGVTFVYSNFGAALAGLIVELASGEPFYAYCKKSIFDPLKMTGTSFRIDGLDPARLATHYTWTATKQVPLEATSVPYYPATALRTTANDLGRFLAAISRGGELDGARILKAETVAAMTAVQAPASAPGNDINGQGYFWEHRPVAGAQVWGHGGSYYGASARMHVRKDGVGVILLANGDLHLRIALQREEQMAAWGELETRLWQEASK
jgi:CubicO group peptidase (beta-lactamase class C family)